MAWARIHLPRVYKKLVLLGEGDMEGFHDTCWRSLAPESYQPFLEEEEAMANSVDPSKPTIARVYQLDAGIPVQLDDCYAPCFVVLQSSVLASTQAEAAAAAAAGAAVTAVVGRLGQLVGVWAASPAGATLMVVSG